MSSVGAIPENFQFPADYKRPPNFNSMALFDCLYSENVSDDNAEAKWSAYSFAFNAFAFLTTAQPHPGSDYAALQDTPIHIRLTTWLNRREKLLNYLEPYLAEIRASGTPEQIQLIHEIFDMNLHEYVSANFPEQAPESAPNTVDEAVDEEPQVEVVPDVADVCGIFETITQSQVPTSAEYVALQIAIRGLRYLIESGDAPEFRRYMEQTLNCAPPSS